MYAITLNEENRILRATTDEFKSDTDILVEALPEGDISDYKYVNSQYVHDPLPKPEKEPTAEEDALSMIVDHEYRLTLLELGVTE